MTVTGKTLEENLADLPPLKRGQEIIQPIENPIMPRGHIRILTGNLAPEGSVAKITGKEGERFEGPAKVFDSEEDDAARHSSKARSPRAMSWSSATKGRRAAPACRRC